MEAKVTNNRFKLFSENANRILIAFCCQENYKDQVAERINSAVYNKFVVDGHLVSTDAETVCQYVYNKTALKIEESSLILVEFDKKDSIIENTYGQDIITRFDKGGKELRIYYQSTNKLAICVNLKTPKPLKNLVYAIIGVIAIAFLYFSLTHLLSIEKVKQEHYDYEAILRDSLNQVKSEASNLVNNNENLKVANDNLNAELAECQIESKNKQEQIDSLSQVLLEYDKAKEEPAQHHSDVHNTRSNVVTNGKKPTGRLSTTSNQNENIFKQNVDRGDKFARSYMTSRSESDKQNAINCYRAALKIKEDSGVRYKLNKLLKK